MGKFKQSMIDSDIDLSDYEHNRVITMWNEKAQLNTPTTVTARQYAENAVLTVAILVLIVIGSNLIKNKEVEVPVKPVIHETHSESAQYNDYIYTNFRYTGELPFIDRLTEKM